MEHSFDIEVAKVYGIKEAILFKHICYWIERNEANGKHFHDDETWTYNSNKAFVELFPYLTVNQIRRALEALVQADLLKTGNFNDLKYDRTNWYALGKNGKLIWQKQHLHLANMPNQIDENAEPIPDINQIENTDSKPNNRKINKKIEYTNEFEEFYKIYPRREDKAKAFDYWQVRIKEGVNSDDMINSAKNYAIKCKKDKTETKYIKMPSSFLGIGRCWEDYINGINGIYKNDAERDIWDAVNGAICQSG